MKRAALLALLACRLGLAQDVASALNFERLKSKAKESVDVSLDSSTLQLAGRFLAGGKGKEQKAGALIAAGLKGVFVRSFEFENKGEYSDADLQPLRGLLKSPGWSRIAGIDSKSEGETAEIWTRTDAGKAAALCVIAAEPKELTIVYLDGPVNLEDLAALGGSFGIPAAKSKGAK